MLREALRGDLRKYPAIYRLCCKEENMSSLVNVVHPDIHLIPPRELRIDGNYQGGRESDSLGPGTWPGSPSSLRALGTLVFPHRFIRVSPTRAYLQWLPDPQAQPFRFERLATSIQEKIFRLWLHKPGQLIHCLSRLDPYVPPGLTREGRPSNTESGLLNRFYWGPRDVNITTDTRDPNEVLKLLLVSKRFLWIGVHCFYSLNTFAFSSIGEFGRFCNGIGSARLDRIANIEILWRGNQWLTCKPLVPPSGHPDERKKTWYSKRTYPLTNLPVMHSLRTLVVHVNEVGDGYLRRAYEPWEMKNFMAAHTAGQPNQRMTRALRTLQGLDYIYTLRGMEFVRFYQYPPPPGGNARVEIRDWSFKEDINNVVRMCKVESRQPRARLQNLVAIFPPLIFDPSKDDWDIVMAFARHNGVYDNLLSRDQDIPLAGESLDDDSDDSDDQPARLLRDPRRPGGGDDSDDSNDDPPPPPRGARRGDRLPSLRAPAARRQAAAQRGSIGSSSLPPDYGDGVRTVSPDLRGPQVIEIDDNDFPVIVPARRGLEVIELEDDSVTPLPSSTRESEVIDLVDDPDDSEDVEDAMLLADSSVHGDHDMDDDGMGMDLGIKSEDDSEDGNDTYVPGSDDEGDDELPRAPRRRTSPNSSPNEQHDDLFVSPAPSDPIKSEPRSASGPLSPPATIDMAADGDDGVPGSKRSSSSVVDADEPAQKKMKLAAKKGRLRPLNR